MDTIPAPLTSRCNNDATTNAGRINGRATGVVSSRANCGCNGVLSKSVDGSFGIIGFRFLMSVFINISVPTVWPVARCIPICVIDQGTRRSFSSTDYKGRVSNRVSLDDRPLIVEEKTRIGDWEGDRMMGGQGGGALATLVDRKSRWTRLQRVHTKQAEEVADTLIEGLKDYRKRVHTVTVDNGTEFAQHEKVANALKADVYFAHPYCAWERGLNENTNGLLRQYFPKGSNFKTISDAKVRQVEKRLNEQPRKALGFRTPQEVFDEKDLDS